MVLECAFSSEGGEGAVVIEMRFIQYSIVTICVQHPRQVQRIQAKALKRH